MTFDPLTLLLFIGIQIAQISGAQPLAQCLVGLTMMRIIVAYHPRALARIVEHAPVKRNN